MKIWLIGMQETLGETAMERALQTDWSQFEPKWMQRQRRVAGDLKGSPPPRLEAVTSPPSLSELRSLRLIGADRELRLRYDGGCWHAGGISLRALTLGDPWKTEERTVEELGAAVCLPREDAPGITLRLVRYVGLDGLSEWTRQDIKRHANAA